MDFIRENLAQLGYLNNVYRFISHPAIATTYQTVLLIQSFFYRYIFPALYPLYALGNNALQSLSPDAPQLMTVIFLAVILLASVRVLDYMRRTLMYWMTLFFQLAFWLLVLGGAFYVYQRGIEKSIEDFGWVWGVIEGYTAEGEAKGRQRAWGREAEAQRLRNYRNADGRRWR